ncbi:phosphodiester glycosidase family protein [Candidatus Woesearchaeota archaeon]|nr:phosphodiester glycosidase family protein [Candidatus Woesearchaeota archaeon]
MNRSTFLKTVGKATVVLGSVFYFPHLVVGSSNASHLEEYCFPISPHKSVAMRAVDTTPEKFVRDTPGVEAAINGLYYDSDNQSEGIAYLANNWHFATEKPAHTRGYFSVNREGNKIDVAESLEGGLTDYFLVLGTHPLLVTEGKVHAQSLEERYAGRTAYRSAIGTKTGKDICFAVSTDQIFIREWADRLKKAGYTGALNLDGGPLSQMAIRAKDGVVSVKGNGTENTKLVIFSYTR